MDMHKKYEDEAQSQVLYAPLARVLVVDDIKTNISIAKAMLLPYGIRVEAALSGQEAVVLANMHAYDIIFMDHIMPAMDGIEATRQIRELERGRPRTVPIIALTGNITPETKEMFLANGINDVISKPIQSSSLQSILLRWLPEEKRQKVPGTVTQDSETADIVLEGLDAAQGLARMGGSREDYRKALAFFVDDALEQIGMMQSALKANDIKKFTMCIHALKSAAASIGILDLPRMAGVLEDAGNREDRAFITARVDIFFEKLHAVLAVLYAFLQREKKDAKSAPACADAELLHQELPKLREALKNFDAGAIENVMKTLQSSVANTENQYTLDAISHHILRFEYEAATQIIDALSAQNHAVRVRTTHSVI